MRKQTVDNPVMRRNRKTGQLEPYCVEKRHDFTQHEGERTPTTCKVCGGFFLDPATGSRPGPKGLRDLFRL